MEELDDSPKWWSVSCGSLIYTVHATTSMHAYQLIAAELGKTVEEFLTVPTFSALLSTNDQDEASSRYEGRRVVRTLSCSIVEWPSDFDNLTDEQRKHGIDTGWLNPDGSWPEEKDS